MPVGAAAAPTATTLSVEPVQYYGGYGYGYRRRFFRPYGYGYYGRPFYRRGFYGRGYGYRGYRY